MHVSIAKMKQSNIPTLKYHNYGLAFIWGIGAPSGQCNQSEINRQDQERAKNRTESSNNLWLGNWGHWTLKKGAQSTVVCKYQRTTELQKDQGYVGLFLGLSASHSGLSSALNEGEIFPHWLWGKQDQPFKKPILNSCHWPVHTTAIKIVSHTSVSHQNQSYKWIFKMYIGQFYLSKGDFR